MGDVSRANAIKDMVKIGRHGMSSRDGKSSCGVRGCLHRSCAPPGARCPGLRGDHHQLLARSYAHLRRLSRDVCGFSRSNPTHVSRTEGTPCFQFIRRIGNSLFSSFSIPFVSATQTMKLCSIILMISSVIC